MGLELSGRATLTGAGTKSQTGLAKILLETDELILRGEVRAHIPRAQIRAAVARAGTVRLTFDGGSLALTLGAAAEKFVAKVLAPPKSRLAKMGIASGARVVVRHIADEEFAGELAALNVEVSRRASRDAALVVLGVEDPRDLARIATTAKSLAPDGALWVIHPKGVDGVKDTDIFARAKKVGLTYTKVARFSLTHTAEKLVIPKALRQQRSRATERPGSRAEVVRVVRGRPVL